jgi:hypothetical protein
MNAANAGLSGRARARRDWRPAFLAGLRQSGTVTGGCKEASINSSTAYRARQRDEGFALKWAGVENELTDALESKAVELALDGNHHLLQFLLKARRPEVYREHQSVELTGPEGGPVALERLDINLDALSDRDLKALQGILTRAENGAGSKR